MQEIAAAKAGICKQAKPVLIGRQPILEAIRYLTEAATGFESRVLQASDVREPNLRLLTKITCNVADEHRDVLPFQAVLHNSATVKLAACINVQS